MVDETNDSPEDEANGGKKIEPTRDYISTEFSTIHRATRAMTMRTELVLDTVFALARLCLHPDESLAPPAEEFFRAVGEIAAGDDGNTGRRRSSTMTPRARRGTNPFYVFVKHAFQPRGTDASHISAASFTNWSQLMYGAWLTERETIRDFVAYFGDGNRRRALGKLNEMHEQASALGLPLRVALHRFGSDQGVHEAYELEVARRDAEAKAAMKDAEAVRRTQVAARLKDHVEPIVKPRVEEVKLTLPETLKDLIGDRFGEIRIIIERDPEDEGNVLFTIED